MLKLNPGPVNVKNNFKDYVSESFYLYKKTFFEISMAILLFGFLFGILASNLSGTTASIMLTCLYVISPVFSFYFFSTLIKSDNSINIDHRFNLKRFSQTLTWNIILLFLFILISIAIGMVLSYFGLNTTANKQISSNGYQTIQDTLVLHYASLSIKNITYTSYNFLAPFVILMLFIDDKALTKIKAWRLFVGTNFIFIVWELILSNFVMSFFETFFQYQGNFIYRAFVNHFFACFMYVVFKHSFLGIAPNKT